MSVVCKIWFGCWDCLTLNVMFLVLSCPSIIVPSETQAAFTNKDSVQKEVKATLSQKATLSCEVSDTKTEVKWYKDGKLLTSSKTVSMETKGKARQLVIEKVEKKDAGQYTCEVGAEKLVFKLQVTGMGRFQSWLSIDVSLKVLEAGWLSMYCVCVLRCLQFSSPKERHVILLFVLMVLLVWKSKLYVLLSHNALEMQIFF